MYSCVGTVNERVRLSPELKARKNTGPDWLRLACSPVTSVHGSSGTECENAHIHHSADHSPIVLPATPEPGGTTLSGTGVGTAAGEGRDGYRCRGRRLHSRRRGAVRSRGQERLDEWNERRLIWSVWVCLHVQDAAVNGIRKRNGEALRRASETDGTTRASGERAFAHGGVRASGHQAHIAHPCAKRRKDKSPSLVGAFPTIVRPAPRRRGAGGQNVPGWFLL